MRFHTLEDWLSWQETLHPTEIELGLARVGAVLARLGCNQPDFTLITVAGTNGKGSSVAMLEAILLAAGYRVGSYTSPHLLRYNERVKLGGRPVDDAVLCESFERIDQARSSESADVISLSYFEFGTLAAIDILQRAKVDIAILEVGLGGRLDAVNVLDADVALITAIDVDHRAWLGDDRETIAREKAGILRPGRPAVCADPRPPASLVEIAAGLDVPLQRLGVDFSIEDHGEHWCWHSGESHLADLPVPALAGAMQLHNAAGVLAVLARLRERFPVNADAMARGLRGVRLAGRFQCLPGEPLRILDVAHNGQSAQALAHNLAQQPSAGHTHAILGMLADKDIQATLRPLRPQVQRWYLAPLPTARSARPQQLRAALLQLGVADQEIKVFDTLTGAYQAAECASTEGDRIVVTGSFYTVAALLPETV